MEESQIVQQKPSFFFMKIFLTECLEYSFAKQQLKPRAFYRVMNKIFADSKVHTQLNQIIH